MPTFCAHLGCTDVTTLNAVGAALLEDLIEMGQATGSIPCRRFNPVATAEAWHLCCAFPSEAEAKVFCKALLRRLGRERALALMPFGCFDIDGKAVLVFFKTVAIGATVH